MAPTLNLVAKLTGLRLTSGVNRFKDEPVAFFCWLFVAAAALMASPTFAETVQHEDCAVVSERIELCATGDWQFNAKFEGESTLINATEGAIENGPSTEIAFLDASFTKEESWWVNNAVGGMAKMLAIYFDDGACGDGKGYAMECDFVMRSDLFQTPHIVARGNQNEDDHVNELLAIISAEGVHTFIVSGGAEDSAMNNLDADVLFTATIRKRQ